MAMAASGQLTFNPHVHKTTDHKMSFSPSTSCDATIPDICMSISSHINCPICMDILSNPITTTCGHTFCKDCYERHCNQINLTCPLCKAYQRVKPSENIMLKGILEDYHKAQKLRLNSLSLKPGVVMCDICPEDSKDRAVKSCLVCLLSYCSQHLKRHQSKQRLKGHKLVAPIEKLDDRACMTHGRPLELYWPKAGKCICSLCVEKATEVVSMESERGRRETELTKIIKVMEDRIQQREEKVKEFHLSTANCVAVIDREQEEIKKVFLAVKEVVQRAEEEALRPLKEKKRRVQSEEKQLKEELQREIGHYSQGIDKLKKLSQEEDHILFIQSYPSVPASDNAKDWTNVTMDTDLTLSTFRKTMMTLMSDIETELEKLSNIEIQRIKKFAVDVSLDPDTAYDQLLVSDNCKEVQDSGHKNDVQDTPERFDLFGSVLGQNRLTDSRAFWVVDVGDKQGWDIGVATEDANRKGALSLKPSQGYWAIVLYDGDHYAALEDPLTPLTLQDKPRKVGVFVDQRERVVSFYDIEAKTHIYSFTDCGFSAVIRPYFSPHLNQADRNSSPLVICPVDHSD